MTTLVVQLSGESRVGASRRFHAAAMGWMLLVLLPAIVLLIGQAWPAWLLMWSLALAIYCALKWLTWQQAVPAELRDSWRGPAYLLTWPGMDPGPFLSGKRATSVVSPQEWAAAVAKILGGLALLYGVARLMAPASILAAGWIGMAGFVVALHFGVFRVLFLGRKAAGVPVEPIMDRPLASSSLGDFWGVRWNRAFRDLATLLIYRPIRHRLGPHAAMGVVFVASGLIHDLVMSVPAGGGYGGPTSYFLLQAAAMTVERSRLGRRLVPRGSTLARVFAASCVLAPLPLLFHGPFVREVFVPFMRAIGAV